MHCEFDPTGFYIHHEARKIDIAGNTYKLCDIFRDKIPKTHL
jgi:hypothetical protein